MTMPGARCYQPFYCEENIWQFVDGVSAARWPHLRVIFITNETRTVALANQRAGQDGLVVWDYHVVALELDPAALIIDFDCISGSPLDAETWMRQTFGPLAHVSPQYQPTFMVYPADVYHRDFRSDRRHMLDEQGRWSQPPPSWQPIGHGHNLETWMSGSHASAKLMSKERFSTYWVPS